MHSHQNIGVAAQIGLYSDAVMVAGNKRWLFTAGTPGIALDGMVPNDIEAQSELAWKHIQTMLNEADMTMENVVKVTQYLVSEADIPSYVRIRRAYLGEARPASMLLVVPALVRPEFRVEVEIIAAK
jgi:enamine deaminase RidA (YjgF/YER057c/UK114 family)